MKIDALKIKKKMSKQIEFSEKIDELNQETDTLLDGLINGKRKYQI